MKDTEKTKAQLIEELVELRQRNAEREAGGKQQQVLSRVRDEVWKMRNPKDIQEVLVAIRKGLKGLGVPFRTCDANIIDPSNLSSMHYHTIAPQEQWTETVEKGAQTVHHIFSSS